MTARRRLVLAGAGHAHLHVLQALAREPIPNWQVTLVSPKPHQLYSGALPGWIAGHHALAQALIPLAPLVQRAGIEWCRTAIDGLDAGAGMLRGVDGSRLGFDVLSLDTGSAPTQGLVADAATMDATLGDVLPTRPLDALVAAWPGLMARIAGHRGPFQLLVMGAGAGGLELAFAAQHRGRREGWAQLRVTLAGSEALPLPGATPAARRRAVALLARRGVGWCGGHRATRLEAGHAIFDGHPAIAFDHCWMATGAGAPAWLQDSGLALDGGGFVRVGRTMQSVSHGHVFAAGDVAAFEVPLPKSGVYAVRAGPPLADNLRSICTGKRLREWTPQRRALYLIGTGGRQALALWGPLSGEAGWAWRLKRSIDRRFVQRYGGPAAVADSG